MTIKPKKKLAKKSIKRSNPTNKVDRYLQSKINYFENDASEYEDPSEQDQYEYSFAKYEEKMLGRMNSDDLKELGTEQLKIVIKMAKELLKIIEG